MEYDRNMNELNQNLLANLSLITALHNNNKSILDIFLPIVKHAVISLKNKTENDYCDVASLQEELNSQLGVKIGELSLLTFLRRLEKEKVIELYQNKQAYKVMGHTDCDEYNREIDEKRRDINYFIRKYITWSNSKCDPDGAKRLLFEFLGKYRSCIDDKLNIVNKAEISIEYEKLIDFIAEINTENNQLRGIFIDIYTGYCLCSVLTTTPNNILGERFCVFSNIKVYLDSNFILRLLDLQDGYFTKQTQELYESIIAEGVCLKVFDKTVDEIKSVILYRGRQYFDNGYNHNPTAHLATGVIGAIARKKMTWPQIQALVDSMETWLSERNITIECLRDNSTSINQNDVDFLYKLKYQNDDYDNEQENSYRYNKVETYCRIFSLIKKRNGGYKAKLSNYKNLFLTCDNSVYSFSKLRLCGNYASFVQNQETLSNTLLLVNQQGLSDAVLSGIIAMLNINKTFGLRDFAKWNDTYNAFAKQHPEKADYVKICMDDSDCFSRVKDIIEDDNELDVQQRAFDALLSETDKRIATEQELKTKLHELEAQNLKANAEKESFVELHSSSLEQLMTTRQELDEKKKEAQDLQLREESQRDSLFNCCKEDYQKACKQNKVLVALVSWAISLILIGGTITIGCFFASQVIGVVFTIVTGIISTGATVLSLIEVKMQKVLNYMNMKSKEKCFVHYNKLYDEKNK